MPDKLPTSQFKKALHRDWKVHLHDFLDKLRAEGKARFGVSSATVIGEGGRALPKGKGIQASRYIGAAVGNFIGEVPSRSVYAT